MSVGRGGAYGLGEGRAGSCFGILLSSVAVFGLFCDVRALFVFFFFLRIIYSYCV